MFIDNRISISKFTCYININGNASESFDSIFSCHGRITRRTTRNKDNPIHATHFINRHIEPTKIGSTFSKIVATTNSILKNLWLIKYFFEHKMIKPLLLRLFIIPLNFFNMFCHKLIKYIRCFYALFFNNSDFSIFKKNNFFGVWQNRSGIACNIVFSVTHTNHNRTS